MLDINERIIATSIDELDERYAKVGKLFSRARFEKRMTQGDVARAIGMTYTNYARLERGTVAAVDTRILAEICELLDVPFEEVQKIILNP